MRFPFVLAVAILALAPVAGATEATDPFAAMGVERPRELVPAPNLTFVSLEGGHVRLSDLRGKVVLLGFFTTT